MLTPDQTRQCKAKLNEIREGLLAEVASIRESAEALDEGQGAADLADASTSQYDRAFLGRMSEADQKLLERVDNALQRINGKDYGICEDCSEEIPFKRLLTVPYGERCIACQEILERDEKNRSSGRASETGTGFEE